MEKKNTTRNMLYMQCATTMNAKREDSSQNRNVSIAKTSFKRSRTVRVENIPLLCLMISMAAAWGGGAIFYTQTGRQSRPSGSKARALKNIFQASPDHVEITPGDAKNTKSIKGSGKQSVSGENTNLGNPKRGKSIKTFTSTPINDSNGKSQLNSVSGKKQTTKSKKSSIASSPSSTNPQSRGKKTQKLGKLSKTPSPSLVTSTKSPSGKGKQMTKGKISRKKKGKSVKSKVPKTVSPTSGTSSPTRIKTPMPTAPKAPPTLQPSKPKPTTRPSPKPLNTPAPTTPQTTLTPTSPVPTRPPNTVSPSTFPPSTEFPTTSVPTTPSNTPAPTTVSPTFPIPTVSTSTTAPTVRVSSIPPHTMIPTTRVPTQSPTPRKTPKPATSSPTQLPTKPISPMPTTTAPTHVTTSPTIAPTIRPTAPPASQPPTSGVQVSASPYGLVYQSVLGTPTQQQYQDAAQITIQYLSGFIMSQFEFNLAINLTDVITFSVDFTANPVQISYQTDLFFSNTSEFIPSQSDVDTIIATAFQQPSVNMLINELHQNLPSDNPFTGTSAVIYNKTQAQTNHLIAISASQDSSILATLMSSKYLFGIIGAGAILTISMFSFVIYRRKPRKKDRARVGDGSSYWTEEKVYMPSESNIMSFRRDEDALKFESSDQAQWLTV